MARALTQSLRRTLPYQTPSRWWLEQPLEPSYMLLKPLPDVKSPGIIRFLSAQAQTTEPAPAQAQKSAAVKVSLTTPGFVGDPYSPSQPISFWQRYFTRPGWKRTKEEWISELKSAYAIAKVRRKYGYSKKKFYEETTNLYQEINTLIANGDKRSLRKLVTENMYSALKNEIKHREAVWAHVHWELIMPIVKIRTLQARLIGTDKNDVMKSFIQITLEFLSKQEIWNYDGKIAYKDIIEATLDFDLTHCIGTGSYGSVYQAILPGGRSVAVKKLHRFEGDNPYYVRQVPPEYSEALRILSAQTEHVSHLRLHGKWESV